MNPNIAKCTLESDDALASYEGKKTSDKLQRVFSPQKRLLPLLLTKAKCTCGFETSKRVCPSCHNELPSEFGAISSYTIALIGAKYTGKSNYIGVLIRRLKNDVGRDFTAALNALDDRTTHRYRDDFERLLFREGVVVPTTDSSQSNIKVRYPLNYRFSIDRKNIRGNVKAISLSLFDTAGEDLDSQDITSVQARYLANADGIIFLLDPLQFSVVREKVGASLNLPQQATDPADIIDRAIRILRQSGNISSNKKIPTPVAVAFSKIDAVRALVELNSPIHRTPNHQGYYDDTDGTQLHESIRSYLSEWGAGSLDNTLRVQFERYRYFGLSSLGSAPSADDRLTMGVVPFRVEDPFLWLLSDLKFIGTRKETT